MVEDDDAIRALLVAALRREPFEVHAAMHGAHALNMTQATDYAVILLDLMMPTSTVSSSSKLSPGIAAIAHCDLRDDRRRRHVLRRMPSNVVHGIVHKPFDVPQLLAMVREVTLARCEQTRSQRSMPSSQKPATNSCSCGPNSRATYCFLKRRSARSIPAAPSAS